MLALLLVLEIMMDLKWHKFVGQPHAS